MLPLQHSHSYPAWVHDATRFVTGLDVPRVLDVGGPRFAPEWLWKVTEDTKGRVPSKA